MAVRKGVRYRIIVLPTLCRGGRLCPPSKSGDFSRSFVGADAYIGPLKCCDFASDFHKTGQFRRADRVVRPYGVKNETQCNNALPPLRGCFRFGGWVDVVIDPYGMESEIPPHVGADAYIGPLKCCGFALDFRENGHFRRADRVVRPYGVKIETQCNNAHPPLRGCFHFGGWVDVGIDPYGMESEIPPHVGADAYIGPLKCCGFASDFRKNRNFLWADRVVRPYGAKWQTDTLSAAQTSAPPRMSITFPSSVRRSVSQQVMSTCPERI